MIDENFKRKIEAEKCEKTKSRLLAKNKFWVWPENRLFMARPARPYSKICEKTKKIRWWRGLGEEGGLERDGIYGCRL